MKSKPMRKNAHKERIFTLSQNTKDFDYIKNHRGLVDGKNTKLSKESHCSCGEGKVFGSK